MDLHLLPKFIKTLRNSYNHHHQQQQQRGALHYGERELSFDDTPVVHVKMYRPSSFRFKMPNIPCISTPQVNFDYDFDCHDNDREIYYSYNDDDHDNVNVQSRKSTLEGADDYTSSNHEGPDDEYGNSDVCEEINWTPHSCDDGIDFKAEQFIANFYEQIKLQRQISYLQYNEMISRGSN